MEGINPKPSYEKLLEQPLLRFSGLYSEVCAPLIVRAQIFNKGKPFGLPVTTSYKSFTKRWRYIIFCFNVFNSQYTFVKNIIFPNSWNEWISLPLQISDLPRTSILALTILDCIGPGKIAIVGGTSISLFGKRGVFRQVSIPKL